MARPAYTRDNARELRRLSIVEIADRLGLPKTTIFYWASSLAIDPIDIRMQRKSNSGRLEGRTWRSRYRVLTVPACDTLLRARLQRGWTACEASGYTRLPTGRSSVW
jgi:hypothetical protein